jgi:hypothetical protein
MSACLCNIIFKCFRLKGASKAQLKLIKNGRKKRKPGITAVLKLAGSVELSFHHVSLWANFEFQPSQK